MVLDASAVHFDFTPILPLGLQMIRWAIYSSLRPRTSSRHYVQLRHHFEEKNISHDAYERQLEHELEILQEPLAGNGDGSFTLSGT